MNEERAEMLGKAPIPKVLKQLAVPGIIAMLINAIYNVVDTMFVGMLNDTSAIAAVSVAFPLFMLISAFGLMYGMGTASYLSRLLGEKRHDRASEAASTGFYTALVNGLIFSIVGYFSVETVMGLFGATEKIMPFAVGYGAILFGGSVFTIMNMTMNNMIRAEGGAKYSMIAISLGAGLNIILDPIMMFGLGMGIKGAAAATVIGQMVSTLFLLRFYFKGKSSITISPRHVCLDKEIYSEIMKIGLATLARQSLASVSMALINIAAAPYGESVVAAFGVSLRVVMIAFYVIFGFYQGFQPIAGYNYGAGHMDRLQEAIKLSLRWTSAFCVGAAVLLFAGAETLLKAFTQDQEVIRVGVQFIRAMAVVLPLMGYQQLYAVLYQALGKGREAMLLSTARQGIFLIPAILVLPKVIGLNGVIIAQPLADVLTLMVTAVLARRLKIELNEKMHYNRKEFA